MQIHSLQTGTVRVKHSFLFASSGPRRQLDLFLPGPWSDPLPIHCWAIEHEGRVLLLDTDESATASNAPFARFEVTPGQALPAALASAGISPQDISEVVLTHHHGDHVDGLIHVEAPRPGQRGGAAIPRNSPRTIPSPRLGSPTPSRSTFERRAPLSG